MRAVVLCSVKICYNVPALHIRGVAQFGSAHGWGPCGRRFKSCRPDQRVPIRTRRIKDCIKEISEFPTADLFVFDIDLLKESLVKTPAITGRGF